MREDPLIGLPGCEELGLKSCTLSPPGGRGRRFVDEFTPEEAREGVPRVTVERDDKGVPS